jgi:hypothetical protein
MAPVGSAIPKRYGQSSHGAAYGNARLWAIASIFSQLSRSGAIGSAGVPAGVLLSLRP